MEVKSGHFRCVSNFIYSYENICDLERVPVMEGEEGCRDSGVCSTLQEGVCEDWVSLEEVCAGGFERWR